MRIMVLFGGAEVDDEGLAVADVQVAVRLRRKPGVDLQPLELPAGGGVLLHEAVDEIFGLCWSAFFFHGRGGAADGNPLAAAAVFRRGGQAETMIRQI